MFFESFFLPCIIQGPHPQIFLAIFHLIITRWSSRLFLGWVCLRGWVLVGNFFERLCFSLLGRKPSFLTRFPVCRTVARRARTLFWCRSFLSRERFITWSQWRFVRNRKWKLYTPLRYSFIAAINLFPLISGQFFRSKPLPRSSIFRPFIDLYGS